MRPRVDASGIRELARALGRVPAGGRIRIYLTGGATAVLEGWRESTVDIALRFEPESDQLLRRLPAVKERLGMNIGLASPPDFIPELPGWRERSAFLFREGGVDVHHFDLYSQVLSKVERGFAHDLDDVRAIIGVGLVAPVRCGRFTRRSSPGSIAIRHRPAGLPAQAGCRARRPSVVGADQAGRMSDIWASGIPAIR